MVHLVAGASVAPAERVEHADEHLGRQRVGRHVRTGAGDRRAAWPAREPPGRGGDRIGSDPGAALDVVERERLDRGAQLLEPRTVLGDEGAVVQLLGDDQPHHAREQRGVLARLHREVDGGVLRGLGAPRVDHDHVEPPLHLGAQGDERVGARQLDPLDQERLQRVGADEEHDVGLLDPVVPALPVAVQRAGHGSWRAGRP